MDTEDKDDQLCCPNSAGPRRYTDESLKMLESDEGQLNAVFALFGSAAQHAQLFEEGLARFLLVYNHVTAESVTLADLESMKTDLDKRTMGQLIKRLSTFVHFPDSTYPGYFDEALENRNFLVHRFWLERKSDLESIEGRFKLLAELLTIQNVCERARIAINAMRFATCEALGIDPDDPIHFQY